MGQYTEDRVRHLDVHTDRKRHHGPNLGHGKLILNAGRSSFTMKMAEH